ncbi:hypothetical protein VTL71DRAFT_9119 [Oculimacula yallundae]|uniref:Uncharacterized protein n=1 Tax=Oculimacula yallundae TaxID=86028 RepID=A0ABR4BUM8_9HELO
MCGVLPRFFALFMFGKKNPGPQDASKLQQDNSGDEYRNEEKKGLTDEVTEVRPVRKVAEVQYGDGLYDAGYFDDQEEPPLYCDIEHIEDKQMEALGGRQAFRKEIEVGTPRNMVPSPMQTGTSSDTSDSEKILTYPGLKSCLRTPPKSPTLCPRCRNTPQVIQQALPTEGGRIGQEVVVFRQEPKTGVSVDVTVDITPKLEHWAVRGYKRFARDKTGKEEYNTLDTTQLATFDCTNCGGYKFHYQLDVVEVLGPESESEKEEGGQGHVMFSLISRKCIENRTLPWDLLNKAFGKASAQGSAQVTNS